MNVRQKNVNTLNKLLISLRASLVMVILVFSNNLWAKPISFILNSVVADQSLAHNEKSGVYQLTLQTDDLSAYQLDLLFAVENPSYLNVEPNGEIFVSVGAPKGGVVIYKPSANTSDKEQYKLAAQLMELGNNACHVSYHPTEDLVSLAFYSSPFTKLLTYKSNTGQINELHQFTHEGKSITSRQRKPHPHWSGWSPEGRFLYAVDLGTDEVKQYTKSNGQWKMQTAAKLDAGDGPRHLAFHPTHSKAYLLNELSNSLVVFEQDLTTGELNRVQKISTLKPDFTEHSQAAAIRISADGRFVYVSNRGENTIAAFKVLQSGLVEHIQTISTGSDWPRDFNFSAEQDYLLVANTRGDQVNLFKRNSKTGRLTNTSMAYPIAAPKFVQASPL
ncbi:lactonase family protein [Catenovulum adriaticum]|uniref:Lactonase family protein n=1 Tax=Catenovulum adriaticum TaxID=2984846 RepID=A0ABY7ANS4_9ALTE|nr:lactonase family protein [Catenovulum sp. TS8]WAJ71223.1 lactonase family protein [Catenovulum sp. TS8]